MKWRQKGSILVSGTLSKDHVTRGGGSRGEIRKLLITVFKGGSSMRRTSPTKIFTNDARLDNKYKNIIYKTPASLSTGICDETGGTGVSSLLSESLSVSDTPTWFLPYKLSGSLALS